MSDLLSQEKKHQVTGDAQQYSPKIQYKDFKKEANIDPEVKADHEGHDLKDDLKPDMNQGMKG